MYALAGHQPWFWAIAAGYKRVENRKWKPPFTLMGERIALVGSRTWDPQGEQYIKNLRIDIDQATCRDVGVIAVATIDMVATCTADVDVWQRATKSVVSEYQGYQSNWFFGPYGWLLTDIVRLPKPIPCRGFQKLWNLKPDIEEQLNDQLTKLR